jgi:hypothetical protein
VIRPWATPAASSQALTLSRLGDVIPAFNRTTLYRVMDEAGG